jgi:hypothetical protein
VFWKIYNARGAPRIPGQVVGNTGVVWRACLNNAETVLTRRNTGEACLQGRRSWMWRTVPTKRDLKVRLSDLVRLVCTAMGMRAERICLLSGLVIKRFFLC